jgi:hypothetical protein
MCIAAGLGRKGQLDIFSNVEIFSMGFDHRG